MYTKIIVLKKQLTLYDQTSYMENMLLIVIISLMIIILTIILINKIGDSNIILRNKEDKN